MKARSAVLALIALAACRGEPENATNVAIDNAADNRVDMTAVPEDVDALALDNESANAIADSWIGRWNGPESLFLEIRPGGRPGTFALTLKDSPHREASYSGTAQEGGIRFTRAGRLETIRPGTDKETGFTWLAGERECLIIAAGKEGYCR